MAETKKASYLKGAAVLAATVAITKIIGMIYKIPLYNMLGDEGTTHFQVTYTIYNLLLTISTAGIPVAMSRLISAAEATGRRQQVKRYHSVAVVTFGVIGFVSMCIMLIFPQQLANMMGDPEIKLGVMLMAPAVFFACIDAVYRGYSQGYSNMIPTAISQILEVLCKLIFGLTIAWILMKHGQSSPTVAAGAIVGVTIGLGFAVPSLMIYKRGMDKRLPPVAVRDTPYSRKSTLGQILSVGIPITLSSSILNIIALIDTKLVLLRLQTGAGFSYETTKVLYGVYSKALTLFNVPSAFIVPITVSVVPAISAAIAQKNNREARLVMESSIKVTNLLAMPAGIGLCVLSYPIFQVLYPNSNENGPALLAILGISSFFICSQLITNAILQASGHEKLALVTLPVCGIIKVISDWILVGSKDINILGAPVSTMICYGLITLLNVIFIIVRIKDHPKFGKIIFKPLLCSVIMGAAAYSMYGIISKALPSGRMGLMISLLMAIVIGIVVYVILVVATRTLTKEDMKLVPKGEKIAKILHIK